MSLTANEKRMFECFAEGTTFVNTAGTMPYDNGKIRSIEKNLDRSYRVTLEIPRIDAPDYTKRINIVRE